MQSKYDNKKRLSFALVLVLLSACESFVDIDLPNTELSNDAVYQNDATAIAAGLSMYESLLRINSFGASGAPASVTTIAGISSDEFDNYYFPNEPFSQSNVPPSNATVLSLWTSAYMTIFSANSVIEGVASSQTLTPSWRLQLEGEARFTRAFCFFYLTNLFGPIPLATSTDYRNNTAMERAGVADVYDQIIDDLNAASDLLGSSYITQERARPSSWTAFALLARVHLYRRDWQKAESAASHLINESELFYLEPDLNKVFLKESKEAIWQLSSTSPTSYNTYEGNYFILNSVPEVQAITKDLADAFEDSDGRFASWVGAFTNATSTYYFPSKYKVKDGSSPLAEHSVVLRLAEQYLIRAEARIHLGKLIGEGSATSDLNVIRVRAGLPETTATTEDEILLAVEQERRIELFSEWGHRWFDLKRTSRAADILGKLKPLLSDDHLLMPVPENELLINSRLQPQNPGY